ncbi:alpha/beta fold hydrolase [Georgenia subflava]|uniref:alpha/beta fold hydrolase n=1 Tax=Georgenia subflava TaxID=1622177 RepID=UPI00186B1B08|nr:alpha/beta hydrolase [Georgenia subflava]
MTPRLAAVPLRPRRTARALPLDHVPTSLVRVGDTWLRTHRLPDGGSRPDGAAFVLLHGVGISARYLVPLAQELAGHGTVYLLDLPGHARLPRPARALTIADFADAVAAVLDRAGVSDAVLVGHSMGSQVATELLATRRDLAAAAVLVGPIVDAEARSVPRQLVRFARSTWHEPWRVRGIAVRAYLACGLRWFLEVLPAMIRYPLEERLAGVTAPVILVRGEHDAVSPSSWVEALASRLSGPVRRNHRTVPGAAHSVVLDHADDVARAALDALAESRRSAP